MEAAPFFCLTEINAAGCGMLLFSSFAMRYEGYSSGGGGGGPPPHPPPLSMPFAPPFGGDSYRPDRDRDRDIPPHSPSGPYFDREDRDLYRPSRGSGGRSGRSWGNSSNSNNNTMRSRERDREGSIKSPRSVTSVGSGSHWSSSRTRDDTRFDNNHRDEERNSRTMEPAGKRVGSWNFYSR